MLCARSPTFVEVRNPCGSDCRNRLSGNYPDLKCKDLDLPFNVQMLILVAEVPDLVMFLSISVYKAQLG